MPAAAGAVSASVSDPSEPDAVGGDLTARADGLEEAAARVEVEVTRGRQQARRAEPRQRPVTADREAADATGRVARVGEAAVRRHGDPARGALADGQRGGDRRECTGAGDPVRGDRARAGLGHDDRALRGDAEPERHGAVRGGHDRRAGPPEGVERQRLEPVGDALGDDQRAAVGRHRHLRGAQRARGELARPDRPERPAGDRARTPVRSGCRRSSGRRRGRRARRCSRARRRPRRPCRPASCGGGLSRNTETLSEPALTAYR